MTDAAVRVRLAESGDVPDIVGLSDALFGEDAGTRDPATNLEWAVREGQEYFGDLVVDRGAACWLAYRADDGGAVGYLAGRLVEGGPVRPVRVAALESMYVRENLRGRGVGATLVDPSLSWARERGAQRASVTAYASNGDAIRFYEREGFLPKSLSLEKGID